ncbi:GNAT family N-acetyltransferase [Mycolicibacterium neoaurum]|uniref:GNAT family N-acetyltransferase n=1 Tax=Mycolicibacterium neoaurum TaxID=1795 RepID=UPI00248C6CC0|nr:GNAT family N-acetyltransferase [Mycolicibacterium neoaurum]WBP94020.1 GNAT family N-acetyltransferase [Mycolicibacterium neoaurum]WBS07158.1 GNAT family N-acetyltransferase [Mycolicibacterium neoaurum]
MSAEQQTAVVTPGDHRFTIALDGRQVGLVDFHDRDGVRVFTHTEIDPAFGGRGLGTQLVAETVADTRAAGLQIESHCSMVTAYLAKNP